MVPKAISSADTRDRILTASNELFRRQGYNGTSLKQIVEASDATTGSVYHFFPGGKEELTAEVLRSSGKAYADLVEMVVRAAIDPAVGMTEAFDNAAALINATDYIDPCPIGTIAREVASTNESLRVVAAEVMDSWVARLASIYRDAGVADDRAGELASVTVVLIEGGFVLARTMRDVTPFLSAGETLTALINDALPQAAS